MDLPELIDTHGIKRQFIADQLGKSKTTLSMALNNKAKGKHDNRIKEILKDNAISLLNKL